MPNGLKPPSQIEAVMHDFAAGRYDVLLSTTIVESGIDIPRANTILVDRADRFGIADLYQLRGRVGRGGVKAFAYFMIPPDSVIGTDARERLKALQQHAGLGEGVDEGVEEPIRAVGMTGMGEGGARCASKYQGERGGGRRAGGFHGRYSCGLGNGCDCRDGAGAARPLMKEACALRPPWRRAGPGVR